jgi:dTDP-4-dehydrorhamnose reductase
MRLAVTGTAGQIACSLVERAKLEGVEVVTVGRPYLDFARPATIASAMAAVHADIIVNAAAYTAVDLAESEPDMAMAVNGHAPGVIATSAKRLGIPIIHISTDYVFDGKLDRPYTEDDAVGAVSTYGRSKLAGEQALAAATDNHAILRTAWVYSPFGKNFVRSMLRLGESRTEVGVVEDQHGSPTNALDIADAIIAVAKNLTANSGHAELRGTFHMSAPGAAVWADIAEAIFDAASKAGRSPVIVKRIATSDYPTPARRPANSRLDCRKLGRVHGVYLPEWRPSLSTCVQRLLRAPV